MKKLLPIFLIFVCLGCKEEKRTLSFYTWDDYVDPELVTEFEKENDCNVIINVFDSNESMYAKLLFSQKGYDLVLPSSYQIVMMKQNKMLEKINYSMLSNVVKNFDNKYDPLLLKDIKGYSVPYAFSMTGIAYRKDKFKTAITSWKDIEKLKLSDKICLFSDMREVFGAALKRYGYSGNSTNLNELTKAVELTKQWKKITTKFDNEAWKTGIASGEFNFVMAYNSDIFQIVSDMGGEVNIAFCIPEEGIMTCFDEFVIMKESKNKDLAYKFIDFMYRPEIAKRNIEYILAIMPNKAAINLLPKYMSENPLIVPDEDILKKSEIINHLDGKIYYNYVQKWDELKATSN